MVPDPGAVEVAVRLDDGYVHRVDIRSTRPLSLVSRFAGRRAAEVGAVLPLLNGVCAQSHAAAFHLAVLAANGQEIGRAERWVWTRRLAAERIFEHGSTGIEVETMCGDRRVEVARALSMVHRVSRGATLAADEIDAVRSTLKALAPADLVEGPAADRLQPLDDGGIVAEMLRDERFLAQPALPGRLVEVGPAARQGWTAATRAATRCARFIEIDAELETLRNDRIWDAEAIDGTTIVPGLGYASIESPRGRLLYVVEMDGDIVRCARALAPTEWNFHPDGPFARALCGRCLGGDPEKDVAEMIADFDPCVAWKLRILGRPDA